MDTSNPKPRGTATHAARFRHEQPARYVVRAGLVGHDGVVRTATLAEEQTLEVLHELLREEVRLEGATL